MHFPVNSLYEISEKGKKSILVQVTKRPAAFEKIRVRNLESGEEDFLVNYIKDNTEIFHIPPYKADGENIIQSKVKVKQ